MPAQLSQTRQHSWKRLRTACLTAFSKGKKTVLMGTGPGERWVGLKEIGEAHKEMFKASEKESFERKWSLVSARRNVAWTASETMITDRVDGKERKFTIHSSAVELLAVTPSRVMQGTMEGYLYSFNLTGPHDARIAWKFRADGEVNTAVAPDSGTVYFGSNGGVLYALSEADGSTPRGGKRVEHAAENL